MSTPLSANDDAFQKALRREYDALLDTSPTAYASHCQLDMRTYRLSIDTTLQRVLGYAGTGFILEREAWIAHIHPDDRGYLLSYLEYRVSPPGGRDSFEIFFRFRDASGAYRRVLDQGVVIGRDEEGKALYCLGMLIDIDTLHRKNEALRLDQERLKFAFEAANDGLWDWNCETGEVYYSPRYVTMIGFDPATYPMHFDSWRRGVHPDDLGHTVQRQLAIVASPAYGDMFECTYRFQAADGTWKRILGRGKVIARDASGRARRIVGMHTDITELHDAQERLKYLAGHDSLTGLHNRLFLEESFRALRAGNFPVSLIFLDLDGLKMVNDGLGHMAGDALLKQAAAVLRQCARVDDVISRFGGDEFVILMKQCGPEGSQRIMDTIHRQCERLNSEGRTIPLCLSAGHATLDKPASLEQLIHLSDVEMLAAKSGRREHTHALVRAWIDTCRSDRRVYADTRL